MSAVAERIEKVEVTIRIALPRELHISGVTGRNDSHV
jgi:hypothetical protein